MSTLPFRVAVVGGGPAGLMAAEVLAGRGHRVTIYDAMPSIGRKFLLAGVGGLNLTHSEAPQAFVQRYRDSAESIKPHLQRFGADALRNWAEGLGISTFVGSSGRVFPTEMKAAPLLRAWTHRLRAEGVEFRARHRWQGWESITHPGTRGLVFHTPDGPRQVDADAVVLALGGASWSRLGSDGSWVPTLRACGISVQPLRPSNCGFDVARPLVALGQTGWSEHFATHFASHPLKSVAIEFVDASGMRHHRVGECIITRTGLEGSLIYALSASLRNTIEALGEVTLHFDLSPDRSLERLHTELSRPRGKRSLSNHLQGQAGIAGVKAGLLREYAQPSTLADPLALAGLIKKLPVRLIATRPIDEAISTAGGVCFTDMTPDLMLNAVPGVFCCGEMLDWEAPTGGYLLTACFATGRSAGLGVDAWLSRQDRAD